MSVVLAQNYLADVDDLYRTASCTSVLDATNVEFVGANTIKIFKPDNTVAMGNYSRTAGFVAGTAGNNWETFTLGKDRGRKVGIDRFDNEETKNLMIDATLTSMIKDGVVPEVDAYTFAKLAGTSNILAGTAADITVGTTDVPGLVDAAELAMNENEVPYEGRLLFVSPTAYAGLKAKINRDVHNGETNYNNQIEYYNDMRIIRVPQGRFYTAITMYDGSSVGQTDGGYVGTASTGYKINFMIVHPSAVIKAIKHASLRMFAPEENLDADAYQLDYRCYYDVFVRDNKVKGIYLHKGATALS